MQFCLSRVTPSTMLYLILDVCSSELGCVMYLVKCVYHPQDYCSSGNRLCKAVLCIYAVISNLEVNRTLATFHKAEFDILSFWGSGVMVGELDSFNSLRVQELPPPPN